MKNLVEHSIRVIWDVVGEYEQNKKEYDFSGSLKGISGMDYCLQEILSKGNHFSPRAEAMLKKIFNLKNAPNSNSHHDAEFGGLLTGTGKMEVRCLTKNATTRYSTKSGKGREATKETDADGTLTFDSDHAWHMLKLKNTDYFAFVDTLYFPEIFITVIKSTTFIDLYYDGEYNKDGLLPKSITRDDFYKMFYGNYGYINNSPHFISWKDENPWDLPQEVIDRNLKHKRHSEIVRKSKEDIEGFAQKAEVIRLEDYIANNPDEFKDRPREVIIKKGVDVNFDYIEVLGLPMIDILPPT